MSNEVSAQVEEIKSGVVAAVGAQLEGKASVEELKAAQEQVTVLASQLEEVKQLAADMEAKFKESTSHIGVKDVEAQFDTKALNAKLKEVFSLEKTTNLKAIETKALTLGDAAIGIDEELGRSIIERARENVAILGLIGNKSVGSTEYRELVLRPYPKTAVGAEQTGTTGNGTVWAQTQTSSYVEVRMNVGKQYAKPLVSKEAIRDPHIDLFAHLQTLLAEEVSRYWAVQVLFGTGTSNDLRGILHESATTGRIHSTRNEADAGVRSVDHYRVIPSGALNSIGDADPTAAGSAIDVAIDMTVELPTAYLAGAKFIMNRRTLGQYRKLKDLEGRPLIQFEQGGFTLVGYPVVIEDYMPDVDGTNVGPNSPKAPVIFGDLSKAYCLCHIDDDFLVDPYSADGAVMLKMESRKGDIVQHNDAIVVLWAGATAFATA